MSDDVSASASHTLPTNATPGQDHVRTRVVGELACQRESDRYELKSVVVSCVPVATAAPAGKKKKGSKGEATGDAGSGAGLWEIEFEDSILFPEGASVATSS